MPWLFLAQTALLVYLALRVEGLIRQLRSLRTQGIQTTMTLVELQAQVTENTNLEAAAIQLISGLAAQIAAAASEPAKVQALADQLKASAAALSAAITANTPAAPPAA